MKQIIQKKRFFPLNWDEKNLQEVPFNKEKSFWQKRLWKASHRNKNKALKLDKALQADRIVKRDGFSSKDQLYKVSHRGKNRDSSLKSLSSKNPVYHLSDRIKKGGAFLNSKGQGLIEYLILVALMGVATIAIIRTLNQTVKSRFANSIYALQGRNQKAKTHNLRKEEYQRSDLSNFMTGSASTDKKRDSKR